MHDSTLLIFKSKMAELTPVCENTYISFSGSDIIIMLESIHRFWAAADPNDDFFLRGRGLNFPTPTPLRKKSVSL